MIIIGLLALLLAALDHRAAIQTLYAQYPITGQDRRSRARVLAALIGILGVLAVISMVLRK